MLALPALLLTAQETADGVQSLSYVTGLILTDESAAYLSERSDHAIPWCAYVCSSSPCALCKQTKKIPSTCRRYGT
jgi:hypothetical protein